MTISSLRPTASRRSPRLAAVALQLVALALVACPQAPDTGTPPVPDLGPWPRGGVLLPEVTIVDASGRRGPRWIVLDRAHIHTIFETDPGPPPQGITTLDVAGQFVTPGLIDPHVHLFLSGATVDVGSTLPENLRATLRAGITTVVDAGGTKSVADLNAALDDPSWPGPSVKMLGPVLTAAGGHPCEVWNQPQRCTYVQTADQARTRARSNLSQGFAGVKVVVTDAAHSPWPTPRLSTDTVRAALQPAREQGRLAYAHANTPDEAIEAVEAGANHLAHPPFGARATQAQIERIVASNAVVHSTDSAFSNVRRLFDGTLDRGEAPTQVQANWDAILQDPSLLLPGWTEESAGWARDARANLDHLHREGAIVLPASDAGYFFVPHGAGLHAEIAALAERGYPNDQLLRAATYDAAQAIGLVDRGAVRAGLRADLLVLDGDPLADLDALRAPSMVVVSGHVHTHEELAPGWVPRLPTPQDRNEGCVSSLDCANGACDGWTHTCRTACPEPGAFDNRCTSTAACFAAVEPSDWAGACRPLRVCSLYRQNCSPSIYDEACVPVDRNTATCWISGPRLDGQTCDARYPSTACAPGLVCSPLDNHCYRLCDPSAEDTCDEGLTCRTQIIDDVPAYGLCLF